jgi:protein-S-isoprenylcysteine O-methyltransferase Ste14
MYLAVLVILAGWAIGFGSLTLGAYAALVALAFHLRVIAHEEPWLARTFGADWHAYRAHVPRWLGWHITRSSRNSSTARRTRTAAPTC